MVTIKAKKILIYVYEHIKIMSEPHFLIFYSLLKKPFRRYFVIPAKAGILGIKKFWTPAVAGGATDREFFAFW